MKNELLYYWLAARDGGFRYEAKDSVPHNSLDGQLDIGGCK